MAMINVKASVVSEQLIFSTYLGSTGNDVGRGIVLDVASNIIVTGDVGGSFKAPPVKSPSTGGTHQGQNDAFVMKFKNPAPSDTRIFLQVNPLEVPDTQIGWGQVFSVDVRVDRGKKPITAQKTYIVDATIQFSAADLEVIDPVSLNAATTIQPSANVTDAVSSVNNSTGTIGFAATVQQSVLTQEVSVATIHFRARRIASESSITAAASSQLLVNNIDTGPSFEGDKVGITDGFWLRGKLSSEPGTRLDQAIDLGRDTVAGLTFTNGNQSTAINGIKTGADGKMIAGEMIGDLVKIKGIPAGVYDVTIKGTNTLSNMYPGVDLRKIQEQTFNTLRAGDTNNDNRINGGDVSFLAPFFQQPVPTATNTAFNYANVDKRGTIDGADVSAIVCNFLRVGPLQNGGDDTCSPPPTPTGQAIAASQPTLSVSTSAQTLQVGDIFTASLELDLSTATADTIDAYLDFDPRYLEVVDGAGQPAAQLDLNQSLFSSATYNMVDQNRGRMGISVSRFSKPWLSGKVKLATVRLRAKAPIAATSIDLVDAGTRHSDSFKAGYALNVQRVSAEVAIGGVTYKLFIPNAHP